MIRFGALFVGLALAASWVLDLVPDDLGVRLAAIGALVVGLALLTAGREPWPACCEHCPTYAARRARAMAEHPAGRARLEARAIIEAARAEQEQDPDRADRP